MGVLKHHKIYQSNKKARKVNLQLLYFQIGMDTLRNAKKEKDLDEVFALVKISLGTHIFFYIVRIWTTVRLLIVFVCSLFYRKMQTLGDETEPETIWVDKTGEKRVYVRFRIHRWMHWLLDLVFMSYETSSVFNIFSERNDFFTALQIFLFERWL